MLKYLVVLERIILRASLVVAAHLFDGAVDVTVAPSFTKAGTRLHSLLSPNSSTCVEEVHSFCDLTRIILSPCFAPQLVSARHR